MRSWSAPATAFIFFVVTAVAAIAETRPIKGETVKALISGNTVELDSPIGAKLPLNFTDDGLVAGNSVVLAFYLGSTKDRGRWWITGDKLCTKFFRWFDAKQRCMVIRPDGAKFAWTMDDGDSGTASIVSNTKRLYGAASALTGGVSALAMVRNAEERLAAAAAAATAKAKAAKVAALPAPPPVKPAPAIPALARSEPEPQSAAVFIPAVATVDDDPLAWLPMSAVRAAASAEPVNVAYAALAPAPAASASEPTYRIAGVANSDALNVRRAPQANAEVIGSIPASARGVSLNGSCEGDWCPVTFQSQAGWVSLQFLQAE